MNFMLIYLKLKRCVCHWRIRNLEKTNAHNNLSIVHLKTDINNLNVEITAFDIEKIMGNKPNETRK